MAQVVDCRSSETTVRVRAIIETAALIDGLVMIVVFPESETAGSLALT